MAEQLAVPVCRTRTGFEYFRVVAGSWAASSAAVGGIGLVLHVVLGGAASRVPGASGVPVLGWFAIGVAVAVVGLGTAAGVAVFARPRVVLTRSGGGARVSAGYGELWVGAVAADLVCGPGAELAPAELKGRHS